ncbi:BON domain-containing protein [Paraburkholderia tagetis]|uniref:BON domain-containing protein n=1 Tax=Paraburkholderia tagetis TaxID=2913261 RepID=A0A9X1RUF1_9BURK|nr:BON domain-containing protein [Paraburkholderia tagetis]MCG5075124.1 BON domain-containing protein [Paraburkholderia tagetis]
MKRCSFVLAACAALAQVSAAAQTLAHPPTPGAASSTATTTQTTTHASSTESLRQKIDDAFITAKAKAALVGTSGVDSSNVHVSTETGTVTLSGAIPDLRQKDEAGNVVRRVDGVAAVRNALDVDTARQ